MRPGVICLALAGAYACLAGEQKLGKPLTLNQAVSVDAVLANAERFAGKAVQVKGKITEVCQMMGCWVNLVSDSGKSIRIKVTDGEIAFPKDSAGKMAIAEGTLSKLVLSKEEAVARARHEAEEQGRKFNPSSVKSGATIYQIQGTGAVLLD